MNIDSSVPIHEKIQIAKYNAIFFESKIDIRSYISAHWHDSVELIYIKTGHLFVSVGHKEYELNAGDYILIEPRHLHTTKNTLGNTSILLQIPTYFLQRYIPDYHQCYFVLPSRKEHPDAYQYVIKLLRDMESINQNSKTVDTLKFNSLVFELLHFLYHNFKLERDLTDKQSSKYEKRLQTIISYINTNYNQPLTVKNAAAIVSLQPEYFCRFFKKYMGITFLTYLNEIRLSHIHNDLVNTDKPVNQILESHGFSNYHLFRKMFFEQFNGTPTEIRRQGR